MTDQDKTATTPSEGSLDSATIRRKDLISLGSTFKQALSPLSKVLEHIKQTSLQYSDVLMHLRFGRRLQLFATLLQIVVLAVMVHSAYLLWQGAKKQDLHLKEQIKIRDRTDKALDQLGKLVETTKETQRTVETEASKPSVQLVQELDPEKAKKAPMKLVIETESEAPAAPQPKAAPTTHKKPTSKKKAAPKRRSLEIPIPADSLDF